MKSLLTLTAALLLASPALAENAMDNVNPLPKIEPVLAEWSLTLYQAEYKSGGMTTIPQLLPKETCMALGENFLKQSDSYVSDDFYCLNLSTGEIISSSTNGR